MRVTGGFDPARLDLLAVGLTAADVRHMRYPRWLASSVAGLTGVEDLVVRWLPEGATQPRSVAWSQLTEDELAEIYGRGSIALTDPREEVFDARLAWYRLPRSRRRDVAEGPWLQNEVTLRVDSARIADEDFRAAYLRWCSAAATTLAATYLTAGSTRTYTVRVLHAEGLGAGLRDVHWVNVFGPELCELIGIDRLLSAPAAHTARIGSDHVLVLLDDAVLEPPPTGDAREPWPPTRELIDRVIDHIGREFFVTPPARRHEPAVTGLLRGLLRLRRESRDVGATAQRRPTFDYSEILVDD